MINAIHNQGAYHIMIENIRDDGEVSQIKFDTGAINTVISVSALSDKQTDKDKLANALKDKTRRKIFRSASGDEMEGYLIHAKNVLLSGKCISSFFYYLIVDIDADIMLLGDDFFSCCKYSHDVAGDIAIELFDSQRYETQFQQSIPGDELIQLIETSKE